MVTVQYLVKKELEKHPVLVDMLLKEVINVSSVAIRILPSIEKETKKKIKISAVGMAIRRYKIESERNSIFDWEFPRDLEVSTKGNIYEVAIKKSQESEKLIVELHKEIKWGKGEFLSVVEGTYEFLVFTNQKNKSLVKKVLKNQKITSEVNNLGYVTVNWEKLTKDIPGIYYRITRALAFKGISIQSFHTIGTEMMIFFKEDVFLDAYNTISNLLKNKFEL